MPPPPCAKCRESPALEGDLWCLGCGAWEAIGRELSGHWDLAGVRAIANDLVVNTSRQVRALRSLGAGLSTGSRQRSEAGPGRAHSRAEHTRAAAPPDTERDRSALPRKRPRSPLHPPRGHLKEERGRSEETDFDEEEEEEEEEPRERSPVGAEPKRKPPGPGPPSPEGRSTRRQTRSHTAGKSRAEGEHRDRRQHHDTPRRSRRSRKKTRRAGRKHQRLHRLATNPHQLVHRKLSGPFLELSSLTKGRDALLWGN